ncbi:hypothetical protein [Chitinophaga sp. LS1]|uniref:hypothetical protein n=1 Tax=Chitinophaga sp. LS1 TaxID=3051176 RepID=UPI002AAB7BD9|nr:hypothetical protein [Chitinophaga sp. LS1]WPV63886.1 hypothetical protein QQL36_18980 [Chitinophaga sp. LS1]
MSTTAMTSTISQSEQSLAGWYVQGTRIRVLSCRSGMLSNGSAYELSKLANAQVLAQSFDVLVMPPGSFMVNHGQFYIWPNDFGIRKMILFGK